MKKINLLKIIAIILTLHFVFHTTYAQKISVLTSQITAESGVEDGAKLFDEQAIAGDPKGGSGGQCASYWAPGWLNIPHSAYIDLGQTYNITDIYLYDYNGNADFTVESGSPGNWTELFIDNMAGWQTWNTHTVSVNTRFIRFTTASGDCRAYEVVLYGYPGSSSDAIPPSNIIDLATGNTSSSSITLSWTSPGDDDNMGTAFGYDIRYSTSDITNNTDFNNATQVNGESAPQIAGSNESFTVTGLNTNTQYYFAIKTSDEVPNVSGLSNVPEATTDTIGGGNPPLTKTYIHLPSMNPLWNITDVFDALEPVDFDSHWGGLLNALPSADGLWNGGNINLGVQGTGWGAISWNGATPTSKKPILVQLPSAGGAPAVGICPMDSRFIICSAFNNSTGTISAPADYTVAILAIQQMIRNILASGNATEDVFVIGKSQGGGTGMITSGLCANVKDFFLSVPALAGFTGSGGTTGAYPGYPATTENGYIDAVNHAKRYRNKATFSISYNDDVTWARGQVSCAKNTQYTTTVYHGNDGHADPDWWPNGTTWLNGCLDDIVDNGIGLADSTIITNSSVISIVNLHMDIFPNPASVNISININKKAIIDILNIQGQIIKSISCNGIPVLIDVVDLSSGIYIIRARTDRDIKVSKFVKE